ncbi:hypothetical protein EDC01DRAFT_47372 [Geopyxis carbonaria]|nr:hypothetical protein EDC01DRAFT_47372 [Geopyxis carbonaria]
MNTMGVKTVAGSTGSSRPPGGMSVALLLNTDTPNFPHRESNSHYHPNPPLRNPSPRPQTPSEAYATIGLVHEDNIQTSHGVSRWQVEGTLPHQQRGYSHAPSPSPTQERRHSQPLPHTLPPPSLPPPPPPPRSTPPGPQGPTSPPGGRGRSASQDRMDEELRRPIPNTKYAQSKFVNYGPPRKMGVPILPATQKALCRTCGEGFQCDSLRRYVLDFHLMALFTIQYISAYTLTKSWRPDILTIPFLPISKEGFLFSSLISPISQF